MQRLDELDHEALGRAVEDARARVRLQIGMADRVQQVRLALAGRGLEVERRELRLSRPSAMRCGGVAGEHVGRAGDEGGEGQRRVEPDRAR